jgi:hypothetical protein
MGFGHIYLLHLFKANIAQIIIIGVKNRVNTSKEAIVGVLEKKNNGDSVGTNKITKAYRTTRVALCWY